MCLVFLSYKASPLYRLVLAGNRDEFHTRPTAKLGCVDAGCSIIGGRDLLAGGMWLGVTRDGKVAVITNFRNGTAGAAAGQPSRGEIVRGFLESRDSALQAAEALAGVSGHYAGFNVVFGDSEELVYFSNKQNRITLLPPGFYGLSNRFLDSDWPKVRRGKELLRDLMVGIEEVDVETILSVLQDQVRPDDDLLPDTGVGLEIERFLSPMMIVGDTYGTRSSAVVSMTHAGEIEFVEKSYSPDGNGGLLTSTRKMTARGLPCRGFQ